MNTLMNFLNISFLFQCDCVEKQYRNINNLLISGVHPRAGSARDTYIAACIHANFMAWWSIVLHFNICPRYIENLSLCLFSIYARYTIDQDTYKKTF